jgi:hypothetical protein
MDDGRQEEAKGQDPIESAPSDEDRSLSVRADNSKSAASVPSLGPKMVCTKCGTIGADVRPNWLEKAKQ